MHNLTPNIQHGIFLTQVVHKSPYRIHDWSGTEANASTHATVEASTTIHIHAKVEATTAVEDSDASTIHMFASRVEAASEPSFGVLAHIKSRLDKKNRGQSRKSRIEL
jgi:hypothetical protein